MYRSTVTVIIITRTPRTIKAPILSLKSGRSFKRKTENCNSNTQMGSICSKQSNHTGGHTLVSLNAVQPRATASTGRLQQPSQPLLQGADARRSEAAAAAERRMKAQGKRGVNAANPHSGELAARLKASKSAPLVPEPRQEDALIWD